jgi:hypothetical protein
MPLAESMSKSSRVGAGGEVREPEPASQAARVGRGHLDAQQVLEGVGEGPALGLCLVEDFREGVGGVGEFQVGEVGPQLLVDARCGRRRGSRGGHERVFLFFAACS